jgi:hypothetical protein
MNPVQTTSWIAFSGPKCIATGVPSQVAADLKQFVDAHPADNVLVLDATTSESVEIDLRGSLSAVLKRLPAAPPRDTAAEAAPASTERTVGRPRLGVTAREVTLLPRHWEWLASQPGGASVALRKLVEQALRSSKEVDRARLAQEAAYRFMNVMAGDSPGFEEATRALFAGNLERLKQYTAKWPRDVRKHALVLAEASMGIAESGAPGKPAT